MTWNPANGVNRVSILLFAILLGALALRIWGIWFGLPNIFHNDEGIEIIRALRLGAGEYDFARIGKGGYFYVLFVEYALLFLALLGFGVIESPAEFGELYIRDPSAFYLLGRATTAIIGAATVYVLYRLGRIAYSGSVALVAAILLAVNVLHAYLSHLTTVDVPVTFLCVAALYFGVKITQRNTASDYWIAALLAALATSTKMPAVLLVVPLVIAHGYAVSNDGGGVRQFVLGKRLWQSAGIFVLTFAIANPGIVIYYDDVFRMVLGKFVPGVDSDAGLIDAITDERAMVASTNLFVFYLSVLTESMSWPVFTICAIGLAYALWKRQPADMVLASFPILIYLSMSVSADSHLFYPRYMLPAIPFLVLLGARFLVEMVNKLPAQRREAVLVTLVLVLAVLPAREIVAENVLMTGKDTRAEAKEWVEANIEPGARIFIEGHRTTVSKSTVPLQNTAENLRESIEYFRDREPGKVKYFKLALRTLSDKTYDLVGVSHDELQNLQYYKDIGIQYFVLRPAAYEGSRRQYAWPEFVEQIRRDPDVAMIKRFEADSEHRPGPLIEIYRVSSNAESLSGLD